AVAAAAPAARALPGGGETVLAAMEANLAATARASEPGIVRRVAQAWVLRIDQDGLEPSAEVRRQSQGLFDRGRRWGLRRFELFADDLQAEALLVACLPEANPRTGP
ncbi:hypothetical protein ACETWP_17325, partial [Arthrobacter halodurans]